MPVALMVGTAGAAKTVPRFAALPARARLSAPPSNVSSVALRRRASLQVRPLTRPSFARQTLQDAATRAGERAPRHRRTRRRRRDSPAPTRTPLSQATPLTFHRDLMTRRAPLGVAVRATVAPPPVSSPSVGSSRSSQSDDGEPRPGHDRHVPHPRRPRRHLRRGRHVPRPRRPRRVRGEPNRRRWRRRHRLRRRRVRFVVVGPVRLVSSAAAAADAVIRAVDVARCLVAATGSVLALIIVEALRTSKAVTAATCAGSALVFVGAYFAKEMDEGLTVTVTKPGATAPDVPPTRVGMQGTPSDKELTRLEAIRQILLEEFMEEEARLAAAEENKKSEVLRLEAIYETRIKTLGREITILKNKNAELSVFAGKAASHDSLKQRAETEIATLKRTHDAEISALKAQISGLEATIADVEAKMAAERAAMAEQLRAARGQYTAQKVLFDSEMRKAAPRSLAAQHTEWWKAESLRIERDAAEKRDAPSPGTSRSPRSSRSVRSPAIRARARVPPRLPRG